MKKERQLGFTFANLARANSASAPSVPTFALGDRFEIAPTGLAVDGAAWIPCEVIDACVAISDRGEAVCRVRCADGRERMATMPNLRKVAS